MILVAALLGIWYALSVCNQFPFEVNKLIRSRDVFHLVPRWTFFAPNPGVTDYHLVYRSVSVGTEGACWQEIAWNRQRPWYSFAWNPTKRLRKLQLDITQSILRLYQDDELLPQAAIVLTIPYLLLLNVAATQVRDQAADFVQFAIVQTFGFQPRQPPEVLIASALHGVSRE